MKLRLLPILLLIILVITSSANTMAYTKYLSTSDPHNRGAIVKELSSILRRSVSELLVKHDMRSAENLPRLLDYMALTIVGRYRKLIDKVIGLAEEITGVHLGIRERELLRYIFVREYLSKILQEDLLDQMIVKASMKKITVKPIVIKRIAVEGFKIYYTPLSTTTSTVPYPIEWWIQVYPDVYGGSGWTSIWPYIVDGGNDLYLVDIYYNETTTVYVLHFRDEDHPNPLVDKVYDAIRLLTYGRIEDVETIYVVNNTIVFPDIWDNNKPYAYPIGQHGYIQRPYTPQVVIYVSNVWNHAMDTIDKNPSLDKITWSW